MINRQIVEILDFVNYVDEFYNEINGIFPIKGLTVEMIVEAIKIYLERIGIDEDWGGGDSIDRERVRDIILVENHDQVSLEGKK